MSVELDSSAADSAVVARSTRRSRALGTAMLTRTRVRTSVPMTAAKMRTERTTPPRRRIALKTSSARAATA